MPSLNVWCTQTHWHWLCELCFSFFGEKKKITTTTYTTYYKRRRMTLYYDFHVGSVGTESPTTHYTTHLNTHCVRLWVNGYNGIHLDRRDWHLAERIEWFPLFYTCTHPHEMALRWKLTLLTHIRHSQRRIHVKMSLFAQKVFPFHLHFVSNSKKMFHGIDMKQELCSSCRCRRSCSMTHHA